MLFSEAQSNRLQQQMMPRDEAQFPALNIVQGDTKKRELLKNPTKIEEIQEKKNIDRN